MSNFACPVVQIQGFGKHVNADTLNITQVEGCTCIFKEGALQKNDWAVFIPVDAVVPLTHPAFDWLKDPKKPFQTDHRVKARRLRGVFSDGFLVPLADLGYGAHFRFHGDEVEIQDGEISYTYKLGQDLSQELGITKYEEVVPAHMNTSNEKDPGFMPVYDMESWKKYKHLLTEGEEVVITEKVHGCNARFSYRDGRLWVGSHKTIKAMDENNLWWKVARQYNLEEKLAVCPDLAIYGEVYGDVQDLKYGLGQGQFGLVVFDVYDTMERKFLDHDEVKRICEFVKLPMAPILYEGAYTAEILEGVVEPGTAKPWKSLVGDCLREGAVIKPAKERWNPETRRTIFKLVSQAYLLRKGGSELH